MPGSPAQTDVPHTNVASDKSAKLEGSFIDGLDSNDFDPLGPYDASLQGMFSYNGSGDAQVVPDMTPGEANAADFSLPSFSQTYAAPKSSSNAPGIPSKPYSWMNGIDYASFGWPARTRLPSKFLLVFSHAGLLYIAVSQLACCNLFVVGCSTWQCHASDCLLNEIPHN